MRINPINVNRINHDFEHFARETMQSRIRNPHSFAKEISAFQKNYSKMGMLDVFCYNLADFAEKLQGSGMRDFAGIVYSGLAKLPIAKDTRITILEKAITNAENQGDKFHILARIVDLKKLYKAEWMSKQYVKTLLKEEKCLKSIVTDFEEAKKGFKTVAKGTESEDVYRLRLAFARIDIAKTCMRQNPGLALSKIRSAKRVFVEQGRTKEVEFSEQLAKQIELRRY